MIAASGLDLLCQTEFSPRCSARSSVASRAAAQFRAQMEAYGLPVAVQQIYSLVDLLGGLMSTINAATICIAAAKANGTT